MKTISNKNSYIYEFQNTIECGLVLTGIHVKHIRKNSICINEAYGYIDKREIWIKNLKLGTLNPNIKLLLHKSQINKLIGTYEKKSYVIIPIEFYEKNGYFKIVIGLGQKLKLHDQKEKIKKRDLERETRFNYNY